MFSARKGNSCESHFSRRTFAKKSVPCLSELSLLTPTRANKIPVHPRNYFEGNQLRTDRRTLSDIGAASKQLGAGGGHHIEGTRVALRLSLRQDTEMCNFCTREQGRRGVGTRCHAGAATDAGRGVHRGFSSRFR